MAQRPYTALDPFHTSSYYTLKRKAKCVGCLHGDYIENPNVEMPPGTLTVKVKAGGLGTLSRTQHFHPECYASHVNHMLSAITASNWKVYPARDLSGMARLPHDGKKCQENQMKSICGLDFDLAADYIPF